MSEQKPRVTVYINAETQAKLERVFRHLQDIGDMPRNAELGDYRAQVIGWCADRAVEAIGGKVK